MTPEIGCILLTEVAFLPDGAELPLPPRFPMQATRGRGFAPHDDDWSRIEKIFAEVLWGAGVPTLRPESDALAYLEGSARKRVEGPHWVRRGQKWFASKMMTAYDRRCAVTGSHIAPTLQAVHIRPVAQDGRHEVTNGLLLRSDVHTLFDDGYLGVDDKHRLQVSRRLREDFDNGREFYDRAGSVISLPERPEERPGVDVVTWHMDEVFKG